MKKNQKLKQFLTGFLAIGIFVIVVAHQISHNFNNVQGQLVTSVGEKN